MSDDWCERVRRKNPWLWRWTVLKDRCQRAWDWLLDAPYWHQERNDMVLRGLRTGRPCEEPDD